MKKRKPEKRAKFLHPQHCRERIAERTPWTTYEELHALVLEQRANEFPPVAKRSNSRLVYFVVPSGGPGVYAAFSTTHKTVVTVLTQEMWDENMLKRGEGAAL